MRYRFTRTYALGLEVLGGLALIAGVAGAVLMFVAGLAAIAGTRTFTPPQWILVQVMALAIPIGLGLAVGTPLIVAGQLILIFLDQRGLAARHLRVARRIARKLRPPAETRPRERRVI